MPEDAIVKATPHPATVDSIAGDLRAIGIEAGQTVMVHSALSKLGWICGGAVAVISALQQVLTPAGTLVMPTHTGNLSDPAGWCNPPVPESWWETIRTQTPAYDPDITPTYFMGTIPEAFRRMPGVQRSAHPLLSAAAWGHQATFVTANHALESGMGDESPLGRIYDLDGWVLLLGVGHDSNTSLQLAEYRAAWPGKSIIQHGAPMLVDGKQQWVVFDDLDQSDEDFDELGAAFDETGQVVIGQVAQATARFMRQRALVDFAVGWMESHRQ